MELYTLIKNSTNTSWGEIVEKARTNNNKLTLYIVSQYYDLCYTLDSKSEMVGDNLIEWFLDGTSQYAMDNYRYVTIFFSKDEAVKEFNKLAKESEITYREQDDEIVFDIIALDDMSIICDYVGESDESINDAEYWNGYITDEDSIDMYAADWNKEEY